MENVMERSGKWVNKLQLVREQLAQIGPEHPWAF